MLVVAVVVPVMTALLLLALLLLVKSHWVPVLGAKVQPLGLGPDTTFLITDIQVRLWQGVAWLGLDTTLLITGIQVSVALVLGRLAGN